MSSPPFRDAMCISAERWPARGGGPSGVQWNVFPFVQRKEGEEEEIDLNVDAMSLKLEYVDVPRQQNRGGYSLRR